MQHNVDWRFVSASQNSCQDYKAQLLIILHPVLWDKITVYKLPSWLNVIEWLIMPVWFYNDPACVV